MSDRIFAGLWLALCLAGMVVAWQIHSEYSYEPVGPRPFPLAILLLMAFCALMMLFRKPDNIRWPALPMLKRLVMLGALLALYAWLFEPLGFAAATTLLTFGAGMLFGARWWAAALSGVVMGLALYYAFEHLLDVSLPAGSWLN